MTKRVAMNVLGIAAAITIGGSAALQAHHAFAAEFDARKEVTLKGAVTRVEWVNPHVWIHVDVRKPDGKTESWDGTHRGNGREVKFGDGSKLFLGGSGTGAPYEIK